MLVKVSTLISLVVFDKKKKWVTTKYFSTWNPALGQAFTFGIRRLAIPRHVCACMDNLMRPDRFAFQFSLRCLKQRMYCVSSSISLKIHYNRRFVTFSSDTETDWSMASQVDASCRSSSLNMRRKSSSSSPDLTMFGWSLSPNAVPRCFTCSSSTVLTYLRIQVQLGPRKWCGLSPTTVISKVQK